MTNSKQKAIISSQDEFSNVWSERSLVTSLVHYPEFIPIVLKLIPSQEIFQDEPTRLVYDAILELYNERAEIKSLSVFQRLRAKGSFSRIKSEKLSLANDDMVPRSEREVIDTAEGILSLFRRQKAYQINGELSTDLFSQNSSDSDIASKVYSAYEALTLTGGGNLEKSAKETVKSTMAKVDRNMKIRQSGKIAGITTGSSKLDKVTGGWQEDQMIIVAGRPGMGKTSVAVDFMLAAAESGVGVGFFSIEMPSEQIMFRMGARNSGISYSRIRSGEITVDEYQLFENEVSALGKLPIYFYDDMSIKDVKKLEAVATEWKRKKDIGLIIIDYIQYLTIKSGGSQYDRVTEVSKAIKTMQRNLKIPIIALAQLSRASEARSDPRPKESDLRDSGQLEQDASIIIGLFNPDFYIRKGMNITDELEGDQPFQENTFCYYVLKNRDGDVCRVDRKANLGTCRFSDSFGVSLGSPTSQEVKMPEEQQRDAFFKNQVFNQIKEVPF